ncbi:hypothetical protein ACIPYR_34480 [Streptomyces parvus]|uniref:hypothetical protein n=1 Tax=Streptomyces parvus TaxID=66428 RepID=UPI0037F7D9BA
MGAARRVEGWQEISRRTTPYVAYLDPAELSSTLGEVLLFLARTSGHPHHADNAVELLNTASAERDPARARALLVVGDLDGACDAGYRALSVGRTVDSARVTAGSWTCHSAFHRSRSKPTTRGRGGVTPGQHRFTGTTKPRGGPGCAGRGR